MNLTLTGLVRGLFEFVFPQRKSDIDWKYIGQLRARLSNMRIDISPARAASVPTSRSVPMSPNFRSLNERVSDRRGFNRWYGQEDAEQAEKDLHERIEAGQRVVQEMKMSGQFPAIREEDAAALREVHSKFMATGQTTEEKLAAFLSGETDDISDITHILFANEQQEITPEENHATSIALHGLFVPELESVQSMDISQPAAINETVVGADADDTLQNLPAVTDEVIASLERAAQINATSESELGDDVRPRKKSRGRGRKSRSRAGSTNRDDSGESESRATVLCAVDALDSEAIAESLPPSNVAVFRPRRSKK